MKNQWFIFALLAMLVTSLTGCEFIADVFKAGMGVGIFIVIAIIAVIIYFVSRSRRNRGPSV